MSRATTGQAARVRPDRRLLRPRLLAATGALLMLAGLICLLGIMTAEALYPEGYSTSQNAISDLGATEPPNSVIEQPSATIFNWSMIAAGILIIAAAVCLQRGIRRWAISLLTGLTGLGILGVGVFPGNYGTIHAVFALVAFVAGALGAIVSVTVQRPPLSVFSVVLGVVSLATLVLALVMGDSSPMAGLGMGGVERWVAFPILAWVISFGGYLMGRAR